tara:strand:- start:859 stop:975 length:117 start_codon:yes stop_codon:yes gene_type:complete
MAQSTHKKRVNKEADKQFFLYVFFHSMWTAILNLFTDD